MKRIIAFKNGTDVDGKVNLQHCGINTIILIKYK